jgi:FkbM family methyltransferase
MFKLRRRLKQRGRELALVWALLQENSPSAVLRYLAKGGGPQKIVRLVIGGVPLSIRAGTPDVTVARSCLVQGELSVVSSLLQSPRYDFIIDAGGHIGAAAIALARMFPESTIVSLEPSRENYALLQRNTAPFPNIVAVNKALLGSSRVATLSDRGTGSWGFTLLDRTLEDRELKPLHEVTGTTVEDILAEHSATGVDVLKLDIEGSEKDVLSHCDDWMPKVDVLVAELHDRIVEGCSAVHESATAGMMRVVQEGEKIITAREVRLASASAS